MTLWHINLKHCKSRVSWWLILSPFVRFSWTVQHALSSFSTYFTANPSATIAPLVLSASAFGARSFCNSRLRRFLYALYSTAADVVIATAATITSKQHYDVIVAMTALRTEVTCDFTCSIDSYTLLRILPDLQYQHLGSNEIYSSVVQLVKQYLLFYKLHKQSMKYHIIHC